MATTLPEGSGRLILACPGCAEKYILEASQVPRQGGSLFCRSCGARVELPPRDILPVGASAPPLPGPEAALPGPSSRAASTLATPSPADGPPHEDASAIECPRCGHAFVPRQDDRAAARSSPACRTVLIVEDTEFFLTLASEALATRYRTLPARTAAEGLRYLREEVVGLVVLDLGLEEETGGMQVLAEAARLKVPCLIFTAQSESELWGEAWEKLRASGATDLLIKGMNVEDQLRSKVGALLPPA
jgi:CheY-like chemotaxis protein